jgi:hypothetical protein
MQLFLLFLVLAFGDATYSKSYLRSEPEKLKNEYIQQGVQYVKTGIFESAQNGNTKFITQPILDCTDIAKISVENCIRSDNCEKVFHDPKNCEYVKSQIYNKIVTEFPDCEIIYSEQSKRYIIMW